MTFMKLELEEQGPFKPGQLVKGSLLIQSDDQVDAKGLIIHTTCSVTGKGTMTQMIGTTVHEGGPFTLFPGRPQSITFDVKMPEFPYSYQGNIIQTNWTLDASIDVKWKIDPKTSLELEIDPGPEDVNDDLAKDSGEGSVPLEDTYGCIMKASAVPVIIGAICLTLGLTFGGEPWFVVGGILLLVGMAMFVFGVRPTIAAKKLGKVDLQFPGRIWFRGQSVPFKISFPVQKFVTIRGIKWEFVGKEKTERGSEKNRRVYHHTVHEQKGTIEVNQRYGPQSEPCFEWQITVPEDLPFDFKFGKHHLKYKLIVSVDIPFWPDWVYFEHIQINHRNYHRPYEDRDLQTKAALDMVKEAQKQADE